jgi:alkylhydroperoxidase family enzyme
MALIKTVQPDKAEGIVGESYSAVMKAVGIVPKPLEMMSASPGMFEIHLSALNYFMNHSTLDFSLLTFIRFLVSQECKFDYCINFNRDLLKRQGMEDKEIEEVSSDPDKAPLEDKEKAMLLFVLKAIKSPESTEQEDIDALHKLGWNDSDIYDATYHGARMLAIGVMFNGFKMS